MLPQEITTMPSLHLGAHARYQRPRLARFGTFREMTREGFSGTLDGGLILGPDGSATPAADPAQAGSR
jgi:hypothetical protein